MVFLLVINAILLALKQVIIITCLLNKGHNRPVISWKQFNKSLFIFAEVFWGFSPATVASPGCENNVLPDLIK